MRSSQGLLASVRLLASDLDGTLLDPEHRPGRGSLDAVASYQAAGGIFAVCTGRDRGSARTALDSLNIDRMPGVYMNGTIVQGVDGVALHSVTLPRTLVREVVEWGRRNRDVASVLLVDRETHYVMDRADPWALFMHRRLGDPDPLQVEGGWEAAEPNLPCRVNLLRVICGPKLMGTVSPEVQRLVEAHEATLAHSLPTTIDIMAPHTNKATGLHILLQSLGLSEAHACAVGDSENDLEMLQSVRVACAMGNATQRTKAVAHFVLPANSDEVPGVVCLLQSLTAALLAHPPGPPPVIAVPRLKVACFGGGGWGTPVARMVGQSLLQDPIHFHEELTLWLVDELLPGSQWLTDVINTTRENSKYLPGLRLPRNIRAIANARAAARGADILIFVERQETLRGLLAEIAPEVKSSATAVVMSKDLVELRRDRLRFGSEVVSERLGIPAAVLMGGTLAADVALGNFAEATLGCADPHMATVLRGLFNKPNFAVSVLPSVQAVEMFAVLKTIVSLASGICDGLGYGTNTKAAVVRMGAVEVTNFAVRFYPELACVDALNEACGWTDLIVCSFGDSRNRRWAEAFGRDPSRTWESVASECLADSKLPTGLRIVGDVVSFLQGRRAEEDFPFVTKVHRIVTRLDSPASLTDMAIARPRPPGALGVAVLGSGNWGTTIARIVAENARHHPEFQATVRMWVHEEMVTDRDGRQRRLTEVINSQNENVRYLPGVSLPHNVVAVADAVEAVKNAGILIFVLPHQYLDRLLDTIGCSVGQDVIAVSLIKGHLAVEDGGRRLRTGSQVIAERLRLSECAVLAGANVASEVAKGYFAEATLACSDEERGRLLRRLFHTQSFSVRGTRDVLGAELCGGLKNVVALAAGFCDGLGLAVNTKAAVLRRGLLEMGALARHIFPGGVRPESTLHESCGIADLLTSCYGGRNRACAEAFARDPSRSWEAIEADMLQGQKLQGPSCCLAVQALIDYRGLRDELPLFTAIHGAVTGRISPQDVFTTNGFLA